MAFNKLLGNKLIGPDGAELETSSLEGKNIGLYFSASWCGPCQRFTPKLINFYKTYQASAEGKNFEIVFISSDKEEGSFKSYYAKMPWKALPFSERKTKAKLSSLYKVEGIPSFVILDKDGNLRNDSGVETVSMDPSGKTLIPPPILDVIKDDTVSDNGGSTFKVSALLKENAVLGFYFSAHWCGPCRQFTPVLTETYKKLRAAGNKFEILFVSGDRDKSGYSEYFKSMPWKAYPFGDARNEELNHRYKVEGIPTLVLINTTTGATITTNGQGFITDIPEEFPWTAVGKKPINKLNGVTADLLNEAVVLLVLGDKHTEAKLTDQLKPAAEALAKKWEGKEAPVTIVVGGVHPLAERVKDFLNIKSTPYMCILNLSEGEKWLPEKPTDVSPASLQDFVSKFEAGGKGLKKLGPKE